MHNLTILLAQSVPDGRVFGLDTQTLVSIIIQLINAVILAGALTFILYKPVRAYLQKRTDGIKGRMDEAEAAMTKENELVAEYEAKLKEIDIEADRIYAEAQRKAAEDSRDIIRNAKKEAEEFKARSIERIEDERRRLTEETRLYIIELASLMAQKYIAKSIDEESQEKLFEEALAQLEYVPWQS